MDKKKKRGITLIVAAILIAGAFISFQLKKEAAHENVVIQDSDITETKTQDEAIVPTVTPTTTPIVTPEGAADETRDSMDITFNQEILEFMGVTKEEVDSQFRIYANSCGYSAAEQIKDMDEMIVDYAKHTITVPCYFWQEDKAIKFDMIYNIKKDTYRFVMW